MTELHDETYWSRQFDVTQEDLNEIAERLERDGAPQKLREIALHILRRHLEHHAENIKEQADDILLKYGEQILRLLASALRSHPRFIGLEDRWFLLEKLPHIGSEHLQKVHRLLLQNPSSSVDEILSALTEERWTDQTLWKMVLHVALRRSPERFENLGTPAHPQWRARLPNIEQAAAIRYAYDPQTYEILCRPGQRMSEKKAKRLQELNLYRHVVTFAD